MYVVLLKKSALKNWKKIEKSNLKVNTLKLIRMIKENPYINLPPFERLKEDLQQFYSKRINIWHRLIY